MSKQRKPQRPNYKQWAREAREARAAREQLEREDRERVDRIIRMCERLERDLLQRQGVVPYEENLKVLGLTPPSTRDEIQNAYRKLAKLHHPDTGGNADEFRRIETAYRAALESTTTDH
jgi:DnaJ-domain-containing protein 1